MTVCKGLFQLERRERQRVCFAERIEVYVGFEDSRRFKRKLLLPDLFHISVLFMTFFDIVVLDLWILLGTKKPQMKFHGCQRIYQEIKELLNHF